MSNTISGGIHFSGLGNGTDFGQIVDKLKEVESMPMKRMEAWKADWNKRYEAFGEIIAATREAKANLGKLNSTQKFLSKLASSSKEDILTAKANADAVDGSHSIDVKQLASNSIWAFKGTIPSKSTSINTSGAAQDFSYTYKGVTRTISVPPNTTLDSFANMVNQDKSNPGVKISIIQTSGGFTFQASGKESGAAANLTIHPSGLDGMSGTGSLWSSNSTVDPTKAFNDGQTVKSYAYNYTMADGKNFSVTLDGDMTQKDMANSINAAYRAAGGTTDIASFQNTSTGGGTKAMQVTGVLSLHTSIDGGAPVETKGTVTSKTTLSGPLTDPLGTAGTNVSFAFTKADGSTETITLDGAKTRQDLLDELANKGYAVTGTANGSDMDISIKGLSNISALPGSSAPTTEWAWNQDPTKYTAENSTVEPGVVPKNLTFTFAMGDGSTKTVNVTGDKNLNDVIANLNAQTGATTGEIKEGKLLLHNVITATGQGISGQVTGSDAWSVRRSCDAEFYVDNWPQLMTSSTNEVKDVLEGVTLSLKDIGKAQISVATDTDSVKENIQTVLDTLNSVIKKVQDLTKYDAQKETVDTTGTYRSQFQAEKGSVLTGNYGVQLFNSRMKGMVSGTPPGFNTMTSDDVFSGDMVAALAQMGIKTCAEEGNPNYGLFMIAPTGSTDAMQAMDQELFDKALANNLDAVISFFASDDAGASSSQDFRYTNHIKGMTKPGTYNVSYSVGADGKATNVMINGVRANESDLEPGTFTLGSDGGAAAGMSIHVDNLTPGNYSGEVSIKQGKIRQMEDFFAAELTYYPPKASDPGIAEKNGALMILQDNYKQIMTNIDKKIEREQERLLKWEKTQRLAFSRLETVLGQYDRNSASLNSQIQKLQ